MPSIPVFAADTSVATRLMRPDVEQPTLDAGAIQRAAQSVTDAYNAEQARQRQEQDQLAANEARLQVINTGSDLELRARQQLEDDATNGNMSGATDRLMTNWDQWTSDALANASPKAQPVMQAHLAEMRGRLNVTAYQAEMQSRMEGVSNDFLSGVESDRKLVYADPSQAADTLARRVGLAQALQLPQKQKDALTTAAREGIAFDASAGIVDRDPAAFLSRAGMGPGAAPDAAEKALKSDPILGSLNPQAYRTLIDHAQSRLAALNAAAARESDAHLKDAQGAMKELSDFVDSGAMPSLDYATTVTNRVANTPYEGAAAQLLDAARRGVGFGSQTLPRQRAVLAQADAQLSATGSSPDAQQELQKLRTINATQEKAYAENPWEAATRFAHVQPAPAMQITAPEGGVALIQQRKPMMSAVETAAGTAVSPLQPSEAAQWADQLKTLPVSGRAEVLAAAGQGLSGPQLDALAKQLDQKDRPTALMLRLNDMTTAGRTVAELVGRGAQALTDKTIKRDDSALAGWKAEIAGKVRGSLGNTQAENDVIDAAYYVRAAAEAGDAAAAPGFSGVRPTADDAIAMVVGRPIERAGVRTLLPRGMDEATFDTRLRAAVAPDALKTLAPEGKVYAGGREVPVQVFAGHIMDRGLRMYSPGVYAPVVGNTIMTVDKEGRKPLLLKVR